MASARRGGDQGQLLPALSRLEPDGDPRRIRSNFTNGLKRFPVRLAALRVVVVAP